MVESEVELSLRGQAAIDETLHAPPSPDRLHSLDSIRGIAAFVVMLNHCYLMWPQADVATPLWVTLSPLRLLINGHSAVIVFFVLSGYVLSIPFLGGKGQSYPVFLTRRVFRIYGPFACAILAAALCFMLSAPAQPGLGSDWFHQAWREPAVTPHTVGQHFAMTGRDQDMWLNPIMWSLIYELRISLLFPLLLILCRKLSWGIAAAVAAYLISALALLLTGNAHSLLGSARFVPTLWLTLHYVPCFLLGILAAKHHRALDVLVRKQSALVITGLFLFALFLLSLPTEIHNRRVLDLLGLPGGNTAFKFIPEALLPVGAAMLIVLVRAVGQAKTTFNPLRWAPVEWVGKVSYSLYLLHFPIAMLLFRNLLGETPFLIIVGLTIAASLAASGIFYWAIERPFMTLGRLASGVFQPKAA